MTPMFYLVAGLALLLIVVGLYVFGPADDTEIVRYVPKSEQEQREILRRMKAASLTPVAKFTGQGTTEITFTRDRRVRASLQKGQGSE